MIVLAALLSLILLGIAVACIRARFWIGALLALVIVSLQVGAAIISLGMGDRDPTSAESALLVAYPFVSLIFPPIVWYVGRRQSARPGLDKERAERVAEAAELMFLPLLFIVGQVVATLLSLS